MRGMKMLRESRCVATSPTSSRLRPLRRRVGILFSTVLLLGTPSCDRPDVEQQSREVAVLQLGSHPVIDQVVEGFRERMQEIFAAGTAPIRVFNANFDNQSLVTQARQAVLSDAAVLVGVTTPASVTLAGANRGSKPLVFTFVTDPRAMGYEGPGTLQNVTGLSDQVDFAGVLDLIAKLQPNAKRIGYLLTQSESNAQMIYEGFSRLARERGLEIRTAVLSGPGDVRTASETLAQTVDCFLFGGDNNVAGNLEALIDVATRHNKPVYANDTESVERGAVAAISVDYITMGRRTADVVALALAGAELDRLAPQVYTADQLVLNSSAAARHGIQIPADVRAMATHIFP